MSSCILEPVSLSLRTTLKLFTKNHWVFISYWFSRGTFISKMRRLFRCTRIESLQTFINRRESEDEEQLKFQSWYIFVGMNRECLFWFYFFWGLSILLWGYINNSMTTWLLNHCWHQHHLNYYHLIRLSILWGRSPWFCIDFASVV